MFNYSNDKKITVWWLKKYHYFYGWKTGAVIWNDKFELYKAHNLVDGKVGLKVDLLNLKLWLKYEIEKKEFHYSIPLQRKNCYFGGSRYFFICPLSDNGTPCRRLTTVLYKPDDSYYFGCRICHKVRYIGQILPPEQRYNKEMLRILYEEQIDDLEGNIKKKHYRGKMTKKQRKLNKLYNKLSKGY